MTVLRRICADAYRLHRSCSYRVGVSILFIIGLSVGGALGGGEGERGN